MSEKSLGSPNIKKGNEIRFTNAEDVIIAAKNKTGIKKKNKLNSSFEVEDDNI